MIPLSPTSLLFLLPLLLIPPATVTAKSAITTPPGYTRILFLDDFSLYTPGTKPSTQKWAFQFGTSYPGGPARWGTNEIQSYTDSPSNIAITPSRTLRIVPLRNGGDNNRWTSARIESLPGNDFSCPPGGKLRIEASLRFGNDPQETQMGIWPAFWAMGAAFRGNYSQWPAAGELDIGESVNGVGRLYAALHCGWAPGGPCDEYNGIKNIVALDRGSGGSGGGGWRVHAVEIDRSDVAGGGGWRGESVSWFMDGVRVLRVDGSRFQDEWVWTAVTRTPKFLILNVAVGGDFADNAENPGRVKTPTAATRGGEGSGLEIGHVAVFST